MGANLAGHLASRGSDVVVFDNLSRKGSAENKKWLLKKSKKIRFVEADVRNASAVASAVKKFRPYAIAHLAGQVAMTTSIENPKFDFEVNALGTLNVLDAARLGSPKSIVLYSSSNKVYGSLEHLKTEERPTRYALKNYPRGLAENHPVEGSSPYGCSKLAAEQYVRDYHRVYGLKTVVFRHSSMYGARQFATYDQGWVGWFCQKALEMGRPKVPAFTISGNGKQVRDLLHADDVLSAYLKAAEKISKSAGQIYNLGGGMENSSSLLELFAMLEGLTGNKMRYKKLPWRHADQKVFVADCAKAAKELGWRPRVGKEEGVERVLGWVSDAS
jgi:CDP-paratose 2-epimerase